MKILKPLCVQLDAAGISRTSGSMTVEQGIDAVLECAVDANPVIDNIVTWSRDGFDMSRTFVELVGSVSKFTVKGTRKEDVGTFKCEANNGIGGTVTSLVELLVKCMYYITCYIYSCFMSFIYSIFCYMQIVIDC